MPYAKALFALAKERNQTELIGRELDDAATTFASDAELRDFFARPWSQATARRTVVAEIAQRSGLSKLSSDFLALVAARGRADHLKATAQKYRELVDKDLGRVRARVRTAVPLTHDERRTLSVKLAQALGARQAVLEEAVDVEAAARCWTEASRGSSTGYAIASRVVRRQRSGASPPITCMVRPSGEESPHCVGRI